MNKIDFFSLVTIVFLHSMPLSGHAPKRYVITAATSGIGQAIAETLATEGHDLVLAGRDEKKLADLKIKLENTYTGSYSVEAFDYTNPASIQRFGERLQQQAIDGIVILPIRPKIDTEKLPSCQEWRDMFETCFIAPLEIIGYALPVLQPEGAVVIIAGLTSVFYMPEHKNSNVLRKMWVAEAKNLAYQCGGRKIRVNTISPGVILTDYHTVRIQDRALKAQRSFDEQLSEESKHIPLHKHGSPLDIAQATYFLLSEKSAHINGINMVIDGGLSKAY